MSAARAPLPRRPLSRVPCACAVCVCQVVTHSAARCPGRVLCLGSELGPCPELGTKGRCGGGECALLAGNKRRELAGQGCQPASLALLRRHCVADTAWLSCSECPAHGGTRASPGRVRQRFWAPWVWAPRRAVLLLLGTTAWQPVCHSVVQRPRLASSPGSSLV